MRYNVAAVLARRGHLSEAWDNATAAQRLDPYNPRVRELQALIRHRQQAAARGGPPTEADDGPAAP
jgi:hypothetical protein